MIQCKQIELLSHLWWGFLNFEVGGGKLTNLKISIHSYLSLHYLLGCVIIKRVHLKFKRTRKNE